ncbi:MAG: hypothetical protein ACI9U2_004439 [Bradymonadia bacterium]|jgi:hypothetical protein
MRRALLALWLCLSPAVAQAFCGFYVGSADQTLVNTATQVVLMREGDTTVLSMQNDYEGPPADFALVVPVPVVLKPADVRTLPRRVFSRVDRLAAPRLVEYWETDPCFTPSFGMGGMGTSGMGSGGGGSGYGRGIGSRPAVRVEAEFAVGEYAIVVLSADDSASLETWLRQNKYAIPDGAEAALRPYVASGMKFFVAKVNPEKVKFENGRAVLSPLRVAYTSPDFRLPVRLGLLNAKGKQDLIVHILARDTRYEVANYPNVTIPTNLDVSADMRARFGEFYAALFDKTLAKTPGAVVTEYAWQATKCDPCPGPVLATTDLMTLGADLALGPDESARTNSVNLRVLTPEVKGGLSTEIVRRILRHRRNVLRFCINRELAKAPKALNGPLEARILVGPNGAVKAADGVRGAGLGTAAQACIAGHLKRVRFPKPTSGGLVQIDAKWTMRPGTERGFSGPMTRFVLTRLHYRYDETALGEDLVFAPATPIVGGREVRVEPKAKAKTPKAASKKARSKSEGKLADLLNANPKGAIFGSPIAMGFSGAFGPSTGVLETGARTSASNNFQGRYAIRHPWTGPIACETPRRGMWGAKRKGTSKPASASGMAPVKRGAVSLSKAVRAGIPELGIAPTK